MKPPLARDVSPRRNHRGALEERTSTYTFAIKAPEDATPSTATRAKAQGPAARVYFLDESVSCEINANAAVQSLALSSMGSLANSCRTFRCRRGVVLLRSSAMSILRAAPRSSAPLAGTALLALLALLAAATRPAAADRSDRPEDGYLVGFLFASLSGGASLPLAGSQWRDAASTDRAFALRGGLGLGGHGEAIQLEAGLALSTPGDDLVRYRGTVGVRLERLTYGRLLTVARLAVGVDTLSAPAGLDVGPALEFGGGLWLRLGSVLYLGVEANLPLSAHVFDDDAPGDGLIDLELLGGILFREPFY